MSDMIKSLACIREYRMNSMHAVMEAEQTPVPVLISQVFGELMASYEDVRARMPTCLTGCVDAIYAYNLIRLHVLAHNSPVSDELTQSIYEVLNAHRADIRGAVCLESRNATVQEGDKAVLKKECKKLCQSPIMEA